ncbi:Lon protease family protein [Alkaliphilus hydrothermalis]|uniref:endopeptidase La n=1 Tax=Alkaliphilus hydrothermalis TaxID=1482730 RepID=A0ABS2NNA6_9FIRM|nr:ATP-binding protein [Alkaliphilus hydrothermalis]MBM7614428.1 lon-related putative ATP-dependent protease [Alkaliphilus hydrothermalis]
MNMMVVVYYLKKNGGIMLRHPLELTPDQLRRLCNITAFPFKTTDEVPEIEGMMGQKRAEEAMQFGLGIEHNSYHMYISGPKGTGRTSYAKSLIDKLSKEKPIPEDWCYVYCFQQPDKAQALNLPAGRGKAFQKDMVEMVEEVVIQVSRAFNSEDYDRQRNEISRIYQEEKNRLLNYLQAYSKERNFFVKAISTGFAFKPIYKDEEITEEEYEMLPDEVREEMDEYLAEVQEMALEVLIKIKKLERLAKKRLLQLEKKVGIFVVSPIIQEFVEIYEDCEKVVNYLKAVEEDMLENVYQFVMDDEDLLILSEKIEGEPFLQKYRVNLFIDNSNTEGAPLVMEFNPTLNKLTGAVEYINSNGVLKTSFLHIKPGAVHMANGGYLMMEASKLLTNPYSWETLKRILQTKEITVENMGSQLGIIDGGSLKLEPIPIQLKVILIGSEQLYYLLHHYDEDFQKYFKVLVDFDDEMERNRENEIRMAQFISSYTKAKGLRPFDHESVARLVEYSSRLTGSQKKLSTRFNKIIEIIVEADRWAALAHHDIITVEDIKKAIGHKSYRVGKYPEKIRQQFKDEHVLIDVAGEKVGVINGLSVLSIGENSFGKPSVITITSSAGRGGIVNIEREVNLSGEIYDKGVLILTGFLLEQFAQNRPLALSARICFEQSYGGVDGDSASSTELYGLLSSISGIPIKQNIAVTGSVNQKGLIQPVGGVTEKIEGFFNVCKQKGLTGDQGVIIPHQNVENLMLSEEIVEAVKVGQFHIYAVKHVNEGMALVMGESHEKIYEAVNKKLDKYYGVLTNGKVKKKKSEKSKFEAYKEDDLKEGQTKEEQAEEEELKKK